jgi:chitodextrinase
MDEKARAFSEEAILALASNDVGSARTFIAQACEADPGLARLADAVYLACAELESDGVVSTATWNTLGDAVGPGPLLEVVESNRR